MLVLVFLMGHLHRLTVRLHSVMGENYSIVLAILSTLFSPLEQKYFAPMRKYSSPESSFHGDEDIISCDDLWFDVSIHKLAKCLNGIILELILESHDTQQCKSLLEFLSFTGEISSYFSLRNLLVRKGNVTKPC